MCRSRSVSRAASCASASSDSLRRFWMDLHLLPCSRGHNRSPDLPVTGTFVPLACHGLVCGGICRPIATGIGTPRRKRCIRWTVLITNPSVWWATGHGTLKRFATRRLAAIRPGGRERLPATRRRTSGAAWAVVIRLHVDSRPRGLRDHSRTGRVLDMRRVQSPHGSGTHSRCRRGWSSGSGGST